MADRGRWRHAQLVDGELPWLPWYVDALGLHGHDPQPAVEHLADGPVIAVVEGGIKVWEKPAP
ncbi:MAG: hypothetical protein M0027_05020 [Candidatus Dormibacteraeota bacterium]|nr:hypothetical protein [Candidatus Dormibacteraeota bacterium]